MNFCVPRHLRLLSMGLLVAFPALGLWGCVTVQGGDKPVQLEGDFNVNIKVQKEVDSSMNYLETAPATQPAPAAAPTLAESKQQVLSRLRSRVPAIKQAKGAGVIGENASGYLEVVNPSQATSVSIDDLVNAQNADRRLLYQGVANETGSTPAIVAQQFVQRIIERAPKGDYFKGPDGVWHQKQ